MGIAYIGKSNSFSYNKTEEGTLLFNEYYVRDMLSSLPDLLLALLVLLIGFIIAKVVEKVVFKGLRKLNLNERLGNTRSKWSVEKIISKVVFFILLILAFVLFFNILNLDTFAAPFANMYDTLTGAFLNILKAGLILLVAWGLATLVKKGIQMLGNKVDFNKLGQKTGMSATGEQKTKWTDTVANVSYYLIFLLFLPAVLNALGIDGLSGPFEDMLSSFINFIPKLVSAAIVFAIGYFIAKLVRNLVEKFLHAVGIDKFTDKMNLKNNSTTTPTNTTSNTSLSKIAGLIAFILILIPITITALEILDLDGISQPAVAMLNDIMAMIPQIIVAIVLVLVGIYVAKFVKDFVVNLLNGFGINNLASKIGLNKTNSSNFDLASIIGTVVQVLIVLLFVMEALQLVNLDFMVSLGSAVFAYLPMVVAALVILAVGFWLANLAEKLVGSLMKDASGSPHFLRLVAKYAILGFAFFMALSQLGIAPGIIQSAFILILGGVALAFGLAFGLGGREHASRYLDRMEKSIDEAEVDKENYEQQKEQMKQDAKDDMKSTQEEERYMHGTSAHADDTLAQDVPQDTGFNHLQSNDFNTDNGSTYDYRTEDDKKNF